MYVLTRTRCAFVSVSVRLLVRMYEINITNKPGGESKEQKGSKAVDGRRGSSIRSMECSSRVESRVKEDEVNTKAGVCGRAGGQRGNMMG